jgi:hypothetical protein
MEAFRMKLSRGKEGRLADGTSATLGVGTGGDARALLDQTAATVTVVVDGGPSRWDALDWAAAEAAARGRGCASCTPSRGSLDPFGNLTVGVADAHVQQTAQSVLDAAVARAVPLLPPFRSPPSSKVLATASWYSRKAPRT